MLIILIGFKSCGKTTLGKRIAEKYDTPFLDTDALMITAYQQQHQRTLRIRDIFHALGETAFRAFESEVVAKLPALSRGVIAVGGGTIQNPINIEKLKSLGTCVYLKQDKAIIKARLQETGLPPFLEDLEADFAAQFQTRATQYEKMADIIVDVKGASMETLIQKLGDLL